MTTSRAINLEIAAFLRTALSEAVEKKLEHEVKGGETVAECDRLKSRIEKKMLVAWAKAMGMETRRLHQILQAEEPFPRFLEFVLVAARCLGFKSSDFPDADAGKFATFEEANPSTVLVLAHLATHRLQARPGSAREAFLDALAREREKGGLPADKSSCRDESRRWRDILAGRRKFPRDPHELEAVARVLEISPTRFSEYVLVSAGHQEEALLDRLIEEYARYLQSSEGSGVMGSVFEKLFEVMPRPHDDLKPVMKRILEPGWSVSRLAVESAFDPVDLRKLLLGLDGAPRRDAHPSVWKLREAIGMPVKMQAKGPFQDIWSDFRAPSGLPELEPLRRLHLRKRPSKKLWNFEAMGYADALEYASAHLACLGYAVYEGGFVKWLAHYLPGCSGTYPYKLVKALRNDREMRVFSPPESRVLVHWGVVAQALVRQLAKRERDATVAEEAFKARLCEHVPLTDEQVERLLENLIETWGWLERPTGSRRFKLADSPPWPVRLPEKHDGEL